MKTQTNERRNAKMKNLVRTLSLATLLAISNGCKEPREFVIEDPNVKNTGDIVIISGYIDRKQTVLV